jgi:hypothetical protein
MKYISNFIYHFLGVGERYANGLMNAGPKIHEEAKKQRERLSFPAF